MELSRLVLLLLVMTVVEVRDTQSSNIDYVCNPRVRDQQIQKVNDLRSVMIVCSAAALLPSPVQLPFVGVRKETWKKKSMQVKRAEIVSELRMFSESIESMREGNQSDCLSILLDRLSHSITNHILIITNLQLPGEKVNQDRPDSARSTQKLQDVQKTYSNLLKGKMESFLKELEEDFCEGRADDS
ncbi:thrombopoietin [Amia ocellicauda]|uniref:thrombopoietin n=1 Tax=Amia ocellicauda TaxID=2972642 RepID=UPI0034638EF0